jgi:streptogramin lyase
MAGSRGPFARYAIREHRIPTAGAQPHIVALGPDGNVRFAETAVDQVGRITPGGA